MKSNVLPACGASWGFFFIAQLWGCWICFIIDVSMMMESASPEAQAPAAHDSSSAAPVLSGIFILLHPHRKPFYSFPCPRCSSPRRQKCIWLPKSLDTGNKWKEQTMGHLQNLNFIIFIDSWGEKKNVMQKKAEFWSFIWQKSTHIVSNLFMEF